MKAEKVLQPGTIVKIRDHYDEQWVYCITEQLVDLRHEQKIFDNSLLTGYATGYATCENYKCNANYKIESDGPKYCPHCGEKLKLELEYNPDVNSFFRYLKDKGLVKQYYKITHHNTYY